MALIVGGTTVTGTQTLDATKLTAFDSLGASTCLAKINGGGNMSPSATLGGSNFGPATVQGGRFGNSVSGTWRVMGGGITDAATADRTTVMHRIS